MFSLLTAMVVIGNFVKWREGFKYQKPWSLE